MAYFRLALKTKNRSWKKETFTEKSERAIAIVARLARTYPEISVPLAHRNTFELLVAVILSAQCSDAAVNRVTPELFRRYPHPETLGLASTGEIERIIRTLGLFRVKAKSLKECARQLLEKFSGRVPGTMEELIQLAGVGRKTANVILGHAFDKPGIIVDTHCKRVARRLELTREADPGKIEKDLNRLLPPKEWTAFSHRLIIHGRAVCHARNPACASCVLNDVCPAKRVSRQSGQTSARAGKK